MSIKTRFAPSPTGEVHFGNVRTALFNVLAAISKRGTFLLRLEDTDEERSSVEYEKLLYQDLKWLGIRWQEGADLDQEYGFNGPYKQSLRKEVYDKYYTKLLDNNKAYYCFCSEAQLALSRKVQRAQGRPPRYDGACANLSADEIKTKFASGEKPTIRFRVEPNKTVKFNDIVKGEQEFKGSDIGDFIIRRANGAASFMFCNAIDDSLMGVTLALRGEDHLTNTPRQLMILESLGLTAPEYGHISLIVGNDGSPLSKRHGSKSLRMLREEGFLPEAVLNYLARLGHYYADLEYSNLSTLGENFKFENLSHSPAHYDEQHLLHWQKEAVMNITEEQFKVWLGDIVLDCPQDKREKFLTVMQQNIVFPKEAIEWQNILFKDNNIHTSEQVEVIREAGANFFRLIAEHLSTLEKELDYSVLVEKLKTEIGLKGKKLFMPLRVGFTYREMGPELNNLFSLIGNTRLFNRAVQILEDIFEQDVSSYKLSPGSSPKQPTPCMSTPYRELMQKKVKDQSMPLQREDDTEHQDTKPKK